MTDPKHLAVGGVALTGCQTNASVRTVFLGEEGMSFLHPSGLLAPCSPVGCLWPKEGQTHFSWAACWTGPGTSQTLPAPTGLARAWGLVSK